MSKILDNAAEFAEELRIAGIIVDPFIFDRDLVKHHRPGDGSLGAVSYETPAGTMREEVGEIDFAFGYGDWAAACVVAELRLIRKFNEVVAGLSAHERLSWMEKSQ